MAALAVVTDTQTPVSADGVARASLDAVLTSDDWRLLAMLRERAVMARVSPRVEPFHFCALIEANPAAAVEGFADAVMHVLPQAMGRPVLFRRPGPQGPSFDEIWVLGVLDACVRGDETSLRFALNARCSLALRRPLAFVFKGLAARLDQA
ncbi:MAG: hypothetical protein AAFS07_14060 [Pseudomonadota bacterium]